MRTFDGSRSIGPFSSHRLPELRKFSSTGIAVVWSDFSFEKLWSLQLSLILHRERFHTLSQCPNLDEMDISAAMPHSVVSTIRLHPFLLP